MLDVQAQHDESTDHYSVGIEVDGQYVPLVQVPGEQVRTTAANLNQAAQSTQTEGQPAA